MAKDNLFLGMARGSIGDVVFARQGGQQVARARNRHPKNPRSIAQMVQRVILSTAGKAYSLTQELTDHSFQGKAVGAESQQAFMKANVGWMRELAANILVEPTIANLDEYGTIEHFSFAGDTLPVMNPYVISQGTLPPLAFTEVAQGGYANGMNLPLVLPASETGWSYQQVCTALGLQLGDQLTFVALVSDATRIDARSFVDRMIYARIILAPDDGDGSKLMFDGDGAFQNANSRNEGVFELNETYDNAWHVRLQGVGDVNGKSAPVYYGIIVSRLANDVWQRSNCTLQLARNPLTPLGEDTLSEAVYSYMTDRTSGLYLNQAES